MTLPIRDDLPLPEPGASDPVPWGDLAVGQSVLVPPPQVMITQGGVLNPTFLTMTQAHARERGLMMGRTFEAHEVAEGGKTFVGIWRTA